MGREIRMVPAGWEHPRDSGGHYVQLLDETIEDAMTRFNERTGIALLDDVPPADYADCFRPAYRAPADHFQGYQNTAEGSPVTPVFRDPTLLVDWISQYGLDQDWEPGEMEPRPMTTRHAAAFVAEELIRHLCRHRTKKSIIKPIPGDRSTWATWWSSLFRDGTVSKDFREDDELGDGVAFWDAMKDARWCLECSGLASIHAFRERPETLLMPVWQMFFDEGMIE